MTASAVLIAIGLMGATPVQAVPISSVDGIVGNWALASNGTDATLKMNSGFTTLLDGSPVFLATILPKTFEIDATSGGGGTPYDFDPDSYTVSLTIFDGVGLATFDMVLNGFEVPQPNTATISGTVELDSNTSALDMSNFSAANGGGFITFSLNMPSGNFENILTNGGTSTGSGSFSISNIPEPSTLVLAGIGAICSLVVTRRRRRQA
jgi:hypothetical protein